MFNKFKRDWIPFACILIEGRTFCVEDKDNSLFNLTYGLRGTFYCYKYRKEDAVKAAHDHFVDNFIEDVDYFEYDSFIIEAERDECQINTQ